MNTYLCETEYINFTNPHIMEKVKDHFGLHSAGQTGFRRNRAVELVDQCRFYGSGAQIDFDFLHD